MENGVVVYGKATLTLVASLHVSGNYSKGWCFMHKIPFFTVDPCFR